MFQKSIALALAVVLSVACSDDAATSHAGTGTGTTSPLTTGTPAATTTGGATVTSGTSAGPTTGTTSPSTTTGPGSTTGAGGATTGTVTSGDTGTTTGAGGGTTSSDTAGTTTGGTTEMAWLPSWATSIQRTETSNLPPPLANNTLRQFVWPTFSGNEVRIQLSNERGNGPVDIAKVHIAMAGTGAGTIDASTDAELAFEGNPNVTIPVGETVWSDPLTWPLEKLKKTALTIQFGATVPSDITGHPGARTTSYVASGDAVASETVSGETRDRWYFIDAIEVMAPADAYAIAVLGDSITDGYGILNVFERWPDFLTLKIQEDPMLEDKVSVLNFGMGANSLLTSGADQDSGLVRFDRDVLGRSKIKWVIVLEGVNDIGNKTDTGLIDQITGAYQQIIDKAHEAGILAYGSPITPFKGKTDYEGGSALQIRSGINDWVRTSGAFDGVVDLDMAVADPADPDKLLQTYSNDWLHPNNAGYEAMGNSVDLSLFYTTL